MIFVLTVAVFAAAIWWLLRDDKAAPGAVPAVRSHHKKHEPD